MFDEMISDFQPSRFYCWMEVTLRGKDAAQWAYRGEGAANIVLAYTGSSPAFVRFNFHFL